MARPRGAGVVAMMLTLLALAGCVAHQTAGTWFQGDQRIAPRLDENRVWVCHGFGCHYKSVVALSRSDIRKMRRLVGRHRSAKAERQGIRRMIAWAERRVAKQAGSAGDVGGLDMANARKRGQMDCIDEATNTTSYLMVAKANGILRHHTVRAPVARGFFLDGRYPHATAVVRAGETDYAVDSWPMANGRKPQVMPLTDWYARSTAR